jgi:hypothetical protein
MGLLSLIGRRLGAQRLVAVALLLTVAFGIAVLVAGPLYPNGSAQAIIADTLDRSDVATKNLRISVESGVGFRLPQVNQAVRGAISKLPVEAVILQQQIQPLVAASVPNGGGSSFEEAILARAGATGHLAFEGKAPQTRHEAAIAVQDASLREARSSRRLTTLPHLPTRAGSSCCGTDRSKTPERQTKSHLCSRCSGSLSPRWMTVRHVRTSSPSDVAIPTARTAEVPCITRAGIWPSPSHESSRWRSPATSIQVMPTDWTRWSAAVRPG